MNCCRILKMLLLPNRRLHFYVLKLYAKKRKMDEMIFARYYRSSLSFFAALLSFANNFVISRLTASSRFWAILNKKNVIFFRLIKKQSFVLMFQDKFHILISIIQKICTNNCTNNKMNEVRCYVHLMDTPEKP